MHKFIICVIALFITSCGGQQPTSLAPINSTTSDDSVIPSSTPKKQTIRDLSDLPVISLENIDRLVEIDQLLGPTEEGIGVEFSPDGATLASYGSDGRIRLWDIQSGNEYATFRHHPNVMAIAFSPDGNHIASGGADKSIIVWDTMTGLQEVILDGHAWGIGWQSLDWSPDGALIASGDRAGVVRLWDVETWKERSVLRGHQNGITGITFDPDGNLLITGSEDATIRVWDVETAEEADILTNHTEALGDVIFSPDGTVLASISGSVTEKDNTVRLWNVEDWNQILVMHAHDISWYGDIAYSPDGTMLATSGGVWNDNTLRIYDLVKGEQIAVFEGSADGIVCVAFSLDGKILVTSTFTGSIIFWGVE